MAKDTNEVSWKSTVDQKLRSLEGAIQALSQKAPSPMRGIASASIVQDPPAHNQRVGGAPRDTDTAPHQHEHAWEVVMDLNRGPGVIPASVVSEVADASPAAAIDQRDGVDLIDRGIISLADAEEFFSIYFGRLDHFLYKILIDHHTLASVRASSGLLTAAICVVGALHKPSVHYHTCYQHFVQMVSARLFSKKDSHDDVRALCIGAFWLSDISWNLLGTGKSYISRRARCTCSRNHCSCANGRRAEPSPVYT